MNDNEKAGLGLISLCIGLVLTAFVFQYNVYTFCAKDVSFLLDMLAALLIVIVKLGEIRVLAAVNTLTFIVCVIGRFILDYQAPWIGQ